MTAGLIRAAQYGQHSPTGHFIEMKERLQMQLCRQAPVLLVSVLASLFSSNAITSEQSSNVCYKFPTEDISILGPNVVSTADEGYFLAGQMHDRSSQDSWGWVSKVDRGGKIEWQKELGKRAMNAAFYSSASTATGNVVLVGSVNGRYEQGRERSSAWVVRIDYVGNVLWDREVAIGAVARAVDVASLKNGNSKVLIRARQDDMDYIAVHEFDQLGKLVDNDVISFSQSVIGKFLLPYSDHDYIIGGTKSIKSAASNEDWIARFEKGGELIWEKIFHRDNLKTVASMIGPNNEIILARHAVMRTKEPKFSIAKLDENGNLIWSRPIIAPGICSISAIWTSKEGALMIAGKMCEKGTTRLWMGELLENGDLKIRNHPIDLHGMKLQYVLPRGESIVVLANRDTEFGGTSTCLLTNFELRNDKF
jgi:hypothetical protein